MSYTKDQIIDQINKEIEEVNKANLGTAVNKVFTSYQKLIHLMDNVYEKHTK